MKPITETRLRRAFVDVLTAILATAGATAAYGCGGGSGEIDPGGGSSSGGSSSSGSSSGGSSSGGSSGTTGNFESACVNPSKTFLQGLQSSPPVDGAIQRRETAYKSLTAPSGGYGGGVENPDDGDDGWTASDGELVGSLCAKASNQGACQEKVKGYRLLPPTRAECNATYGTQQGYDGFSCSTNYILYTRGDEIGIARGGAETKALIGTFDTLEEAMWAANGAGYQRSCSSSNGSSTGADPDSEFRRTSDGGWDLNLLEYENCGDTTFSVTIHVDPSGTVTETSRKDLQKKPGCAVAGRRPNGLCLEPIVSHSGRPGGSSVGEHFAAMATLEAASVVAFRRLYRQLKSFGAPSDLLARVRKAARDEIRHARATTKLALKYGVTPSKPQIAPENGSAGGPTTSLLTIALENAREGCVRETFGALVAHLQITRARDLDVRRCMAEIAGEETEHAALSWDISAWIESQVSESDRECIINERRDAFAALSEELKSDAPDERVRFISGVPTGEEAVRMLQGLEPFMKIAA